jgi:Ser/Thr protein kinase RdoA (MazF antagonist)
MDAIPEGLRQAVDDRYGLRGRARPIAAGMSGSWLWRLESDPPVLVRRSRYCELEDVIRTGGIADRLARTVPEVVAPLKGSDGEPAFLWDGLPVSLWPYIEGEELDRHDPELIKQAAGLLARLHQAEPVSPDDVIDQRIPGEDNVPAAAKLLPDRELDEWLRSWSHPSTATDPIGWMHGDFFWRNVLCRQGRIVGLIDWDDAWCGRLIIELAWATWEFGKSPGGDALRRDRVIEFLTSYREAGGPVQPSADLIPIIRERLRRDLAFFRRVAAMGHQIDPADERAKFDAFASLADVSLEP